MFSHGKVVGGYLWYEFVDSASLGNVFFETPVVAGTILKLVEAGVLASFNNARKCVLQIESPSIQNGYVQFFQVFRDSRAIHK